MTRTTVSAERTLNAPAHVVYHLLSDYREHHRPGGFLPPAFRDLRIERGGVGAGTVFTVTSVLAGRPRSAQQTVTEPQPGRVLVEGGDGVETTFTVEPEGESACRVRFDTVLTLGGVEGLMTRLFGARLLKPMYEDELSRLEAAARAHG